MDIVIFCRIAKLADASSWAPLWPVWQLLHFLKHRSDMNFQVCFLFFSTPEEGKNGRARNHAIFLRTQDSSPSTVWIILSCCLFIPVSCANKRNKSVPVKDKQQERIQPSFDRYVHVRCLTAVTYCHNWHMTSTEFIYSFPIPLLDMHSWGLSIHQTMTESIINEFFLPQWRRNCWSSRYFFILRGEQNSTRSLSLTHQRSPDSTLISPQPPHANCMSIIETTFFSFSPLNNANVGRIYLFIRERERDMKCKRGVICSPHRIEILCNISFPVCAEHQRRIKSSRRDVMMCRNVRNRSHSDSIELLAYTRPNWVYRARSIFATMKTDGGMFAIEIRWTVRRK